MTAKQLVLAKEMEYPDPDDVGVSLYNSSWEYAGNLVVDAQLVVIDPPWNFSQRFGKGTPYAPMSTSEVKEAIGEMASWLNGPCRILLWTSWAILPELWGWQIQKFRLVTGGSWSKSGPDDSGHYGSGYHHAGCSEPFLLFVKGSPPNDRSKLRNSWVEPPSEHSRKPRRWARQQVRRWTTPRGLVFEPFAGLGQFARACYEENRRYCGTEINYDTYAKSLELFWENE